MKILIIGGNEITKVLINLLGKKHEITVIEKDKEVAVQMGNSLDALVINGDGSDFGTLKDAGLDECDVVIVNTGKDESNLMIGQLAKSEKDKKVITLVHTPKNTEIFARLGLNSFVSPTTAAAIELKKMLSSYGSEKIIAQFDNGSVQLIEHRIEKGSLLIGQPAQISGAKICAVQRSGEVFLPEEDFILEENDVLDIAVNTENVAEIVKLLKSPL